MKVTLFTRKPVTKLAASDLRAFPLWEFATGEESHPDRDETWVRPIRAKAVPADAYTQIVAASFAAQSSSSPRIGFMVVTTAEQPAEIEPGAVLFRWGYHLIPPADDPELAEFAESLGLAFPLAYSLLIPLAGESQPREGTIQ